MTIIISAIIVGQLFSMTPDYTKAREASSKVFSFLEKKPEIDSYSNKGIHPVRLLFPTCYLFQNVEK